MAIYHRQGCLKQLLRLLWPSCERHSGAPVWKCNRQVHSLLFWLLGTGVKPINTHRQARTCRHTQVPGLPGLTWQPATLRFPARSDSLTVFHHSHLQPVSTENNSLTRSLRLPCTSLCQRLLQSLARSTPSCLFMAVFFLLTSSFSRIDWVLDI